MFQPTDLKLFDMAQDAQLSSGGDRVARSETTLDYSSDGEPASRIMVASADGSGQPRVLRRAARLQPAEASTGWWLAYMFLPSRGHPA